MRVFDHPNMSNSWRCPICGTYSDSPVILAAIAGTEDENIVQAEQIHMDCIELTLFKKQDSCALGQMFTWRGKE